MANETENAASRAAEGILLGDTQQPAQQDNQQQQAAQNNDTGQQQNQQQSQQQNQQSQQQAAKPDAQQAQQANPEIKFEDEPAVQPPAFDKEKWKQDTFGTTDEVVLKDIFSKYPTTKTQLEEAAVKLAAPKYNSKAVEVFDEILGKVGGDLKTQTSFIKRTLDLLTTDESKLEPSDLVKFQLQMEHPTLTSDEVNEWIAQTYKQGDDFTPEQQRTGSIQMKIDAAKAGITVKELKAKALADDGSAGKQDALAQLQVEKLKSDWKPVATKVVEDFKAIKLSIGKVNGKSASLNFEVPKDVAKNYEDMIYQSMVAGGGLPNANTMETAKSTLEALYVRDNLNHISEFIWNKANSDGIKKEIETYHNPSVTGQGNATQVSKTEDRDDMLYKALGGK